MFQVIGNQTPTYEQIQKLDYLNMVIKEVLRMYPPVAFIPGKYAAKDTVIAGYKIPKGVSIFKNFIFLMFKRQWFQFQFIVFITQKMFIKIHMNLDQKDGMK